MSLCVDIHKEFEGFCLDVSLESEGGVLGLLGASGSGKSMTLMCIAGIVKPDRGRIVVDGITLYDSARRVNLPPQQRRVGYLFQNYALFPNMTVRQNILCGLRGEKNGRRRDEALGDIVGLMHLDGLEHRRPSQLSGGQQQRTALARILVGKPDLLMLDEPFNALDSHLRGQMQILMQSVFQQFGKSVLMVTHDRSEAYRLCDALALTDEGKVIACKGTEALFADPESRQAALLTGCKNVADARKTGPYKIDVPAWGIRLTADQPVRDGLCAVGVRAHDFHPDIPQNRYPVRLTGEMEEAFEHIYLFRYEGQSDGGADLWWRVPKPHGAQGYPTMPGVLGVSPADVLLLYK